ncbi:MAG: hypothetical protein MJY57_02725, partial [Bacteroidales bacterium]|nr:hypothetical protein [Bacteroidales bacterium]
MDKNSVTGFILIALILFGFTFYESKQAQKAEQARIQRDSIELARKIELGLVDTSAVALAVADNVAAAAASEAPESPRRSIYKDAALDSASVAESKTVVLENSKLKLELATKGAMPHSVLVKDYFNHDST